MDLQVVEHLDELGIIVIHNAAVAHIQGVNPVHLLLGQREVPDGEVLLHTLPVHSLGKDHHAPLDIPTQGHLGGSLTVGTADLCQYMIGENTILAFCEGPPCLGDHAIVQHNLHGLLLVEEGVDLHLVHGWFYLHGLAEVQQPGGVEIADTNGPELSVPVCLFHSPPGTQVISHRLVDQIQVQVIQTQVVE